MESVMVFLVGLLLRFLLLVLLFTLFALPVAGAVFAIHGVGLLRARAGRTVDAGGVGFKPGVAYTAAHAWIKHLWGRTVKIGLDDVARRVLSGASSISLPPAGSRLRAGGVLAIVRSGQRLVAIPSPVDGVVIARYRALSDEPSLFERDPYDGGWMVRVETDGRGRPRAHRGAEAKAWLRDENARLSRFLEARLGLASADGGTLTGTPAALLTPEAWREAASTFLQAA
jgi:glycine cleavage system H protein